MATLEAELAEALPTAARQAAPFRRREQLKKPEGEQKKSGQKPGHEGHYRQAPSQIDQTVEVPLPGCPHCAAELEHVRRLEQIIEELPPFRPLRIKVITFEGGCPRHGPVRSTHPLQTSTAVGAAGPAREVRFRDRLRRQQTHLFGCLEDPAAEPTNNRAERDLRPAVMQRKTGCGNRTERGKDAWQILRSIVVTAAKAGDDLLATLATRLQLAPA